MPPLGPNRYSQIIEDIFLAHYREGAREVAFTRDELVRAAQERGIEQVKNLGDIIYSFRYRTELPDRVRSTAPGGESWIILPAGKGRYRFVLRKAVNITPNVALAETKIPDSTPGVIAMYATDDEQALLAKIRYNRLIDVFTGVVCYSLQNHLRTAVPRLGQVETDELYIGIDKRGAQYVFPVQAKGMHERVGIVQIEQDLALCQHRFPELICRPVAAQLMTDDLIGMFELEQADEGVVIANEKHYRLAAPDALNPADLAAYRSRPW